ncbi:hypothetical protein OPIT5_18410 [Opitutaceae bacterium TAV5]|nr:hypothetical protein OPIT5_18410 [Opitutaceae bacterium TAV5]
MILCDTTTQPTLHCDPGEPACLRYAVADLASDLGKISGCVHAVRPLPPSPGNDSPIIVAGTSRNPALRAFAAANGIDIATLDAPDACERFRIQILPTPAACDRGADGSRNATIFLCGSDERGAMWAVYEFCERFLGVDPLYLWTDNAPARQPVLDLPPGIHEDQPRTFRYRGWFINDEDLLSDWRDGGGTRDIDYPFYHQVVHPDVMMRVIETALRLKQNLLIPASFLDITNPAEETLVRLATERGLFVSQHHIEPLGVSHFALERYWRARGRPTPPSYVTEPDLVRETWRHYAARWARYPGVVWQLGLRGRGDQPVWDSDSQVAADMEARGALISCAIADQHAIVREALGHDNFVSTSTLWKEGTTLHNAGFLKFPGDTIVLFADTLQTPRAAGGQHFYAQHWGDDFYSVTHRPGHAYGIYYHVAVWRSGPHLAQGVPPAKIHQVVGEAIARGDTALAITNVANLREVVLGIRLAAALTWDFPAFQPEPFLNAWCERQFGNAAARDAARLYEKFNDAFPSLPTEDGGHRALWHDGAMRESGIACLDAIERSGESPDLWRENFTPETVGNLKKWTAHSLGGWTAALSLAREIAPRIPPGRASFFHHHFEVQAAIMIGLAEWLSGLLRAFDASMSETKNAGAAAGSDRVVRELEIAATALDRAIAIRTASETGQWRHWYRGDHKMNLPALARQTRELS